MSDTKKRCGSFGARACRAMRKRILEHGMDALPRSWRRKWMMQRIIATPPWADMAAIKAVYVRAAELGAQTGKAYTVDHIIPLNHPRVCAGTSNQNPQRPISARVTPGASGRGIYSRSRSS